MVHGGACRLGFCVVQPFLVIRAYREKERVIVLDPSGTFHVGPSLGFEEATKLHEQCALLARLALYQRINGLDFPEPARTAVPARGGAEGAGANFRQREELWRSPHETRGAEATVLETRENLVLVQAEGQLVRTGRRRAGFGES